ERRRVARRREPESSKPSRQQPQEPQQPARLMKAKEQPQQPNPVMALAAAQHAESQNPVLPPPTQNWRLPPAPCLYPASAFADQPASPPRPDSASCGLSPAPC